MTNNHKCTEFGWFCNRILSKLPYEGYELIFKAGRHTVFAIPYRNVVGFLPKCLKVFNIVIILFLVASRILFGLDKSVNPCDDFYQYACGGWEAKTAIPGYRGSVSQFSQMREAISMQLRGMYDTSDIYMLIGQPSFSAELHVM